MLYQPEIPPNTGNVARLCAATGTALHLIEPLGFSLEDKYLKRAGLDYWPYVRLTVWANWQDYLDAQSASARLVFTSSRQGALHHRFLFTPSDTLVFGPEAKGLPAELLERNAPLVRVPVMPQVRSLNLSTAAGIVLYEALRQTGGLDDARFTGSPGQ